MANHQTLGESAKASLLWGGGFHLIRDVAQFAAMLVMVRLLTPEDYGSAALAQAIVGLISVISFGTLVLHVLQFRDPEQVDWQAHFTAAVVINTTLFGCTLLAAWAMSSTIQYAQAALPLAILSVTFLIEIPGTLRHRMLETRHEWIHLRLILIMGALLGLGVGLIIALLGGGVWALVVQSPLFGLPAAIDLFWRGRWRPDWTWSWSRYRNAVRFGVTRMGSAALTRGRQTVESSVLTSSYDFAGLGIFNRSIGLATLLAGRIGPLTISALYAVVTRTDQGSEQFQRMASLILRGVVWTSVPAAAFLALSADDLVSLLYGEQWAEVGPLLPLAVASVGLAGIAATMASLLLANNQAKLCMTIDFFAATSATALALWLIPIGVIPYLTALSAHALVVMLITLTVLVRTGGMAPTAPIPAFVPALLASGAASIAIVCLRSELLTSSSLVFRISLDAGIFCLVYLLVLRIVFTASLREFLQVAPGGARLMVLLKLI